MYLNACKTSKCQSKIRYKVKQSLLIVEEQFFGKKSKNSIGEKNNPTVYSRIGVAQTGTMNSTYGPTPTHKRSLELASKQLKEIKAKLETIINIEIPKLEKELIKHGAPWIEGTPLP